MSPFESIGTFKTPTTEEVNKGLNEIEKATILEEEADAKSLGLTRGEYQELNKIPISSTKTETTETPSVEDFIKKWEKDNNIETQYEYEQLDEKTEVINNTSHIMSKFFLAAIVRLARSEIQKSIQKDC